MIPEGEAVIVWLLSVLIFVSAPTALAWSARRPADSARLLQAYAGGVTGGLATVSLPVALAGNGIAGLQKLPQPLVAGVLTALIVAGRTRRQAP